MSSKNNCFNSLVLLVSIFLSSVSFAVADEGMYAPGQISGLPLKERGLKIKPIEIYNPAGGGLTEAVVRLSVGCTGEFISPEGLILTNHHCAFESLVSASTPAKDLVEVGFNAGGRPGEIPAKNYSIFITEREEDVTSRVRSGTDSLNGPALAAALKKNADELAAAEQAKAPGGSTVRVQALNSGFYYYLYQTRQIKDIRIVYAPPRNIGVFGGDPDNFEWTRHTGDFAMIRAYTAPDGTAAEYSPNNVPYKTKKFLTINVGGVKENDFIFVLGYPGATTRYRESWSMQYARDANFPFLYRYLRALSDSLRSIGSTDEAKRIAFQSDIANFDNSRKLYEGGAQRLKLANVVQQRQAEEAKLAIWIAADPDRQKRFGNVITELKNLSLETNAAQNRDVIVRRFPDPNSMAVFGQLAAAATAVKLGQTLTDAQKAERLAAIQKAFKDRESAHEREMLKFFLRQMDELPSDQRFAGADKQFAGKTGKARREAEAAFAASIAEDELLTPEKVMQMYSMPWSDIQAKHPFLASVVDERTALAARTAKFNENIDRLRLAYMSALTGMKGGTVYPDANSTLRFSYGNIKGYQPREAESRTPFTTLKGMLEKDTGENPFDAPAKMRDLQNARDFGRYGEGDTVILNFLASSDIIGGNSGSPVLNANGEQIGLVFDGNYEGLGNDFYYDPAVNRTIAVDIRYVLFVVEKFSGAGYLLNEMKIVGGPKGKAAGQ